jgi:tetratricopeptide (TPR) repeat protein
MLTVRLTQSDAGDATHRVQVDLQDDEGLQSAVSQFRFELLDQDREDLRWYLEDYLEYPLEPTPAIAARVERRMHELGRELFAKLFPDGSDARDLWAEIRPQLDRARVEVVSEVEAAAVLPWELVRDPRTDVPLSLRADSFVRAQHQTARRPRRIRTGGNKIRVLLVICRPAGSRDVPFRSVASHLVRLSGDANELFQLDVLRPPTFEQLARRLRAADDAGEPYHVVHFDGHGAWVDLLGERTAGARGGPTPLRYAPVSVVSPTRSGHHGYLVFEDPANEANEQFVDGPALGQLLVDTQVPVLVLNACRSAHSDVATTPDQVDVEQSDVHARVRAYGSLAQEVVDAGVPGVVAMRYNVYVVTAAQFVADLYVSLLQGEPVGEAVSAGRKQLWAQPNREIAFVPRPLQDWVVPVVYEAEPVRLFSRSEVDREVTVTLDKTAMRERGRQVGQNLPDNPDTGFYGRDETLLALDRGFDTQPIVLLHGYAGSGKTTTAAEFARWYWLTGGSTGPVLFTSFERYLPLARVLDTLGDAFAAVLRGAGVEWLALNDDQRLDVALQLLEQFPVLWIWDNVEPIAGFPAGSPSAWPLGEQQELADFLRRCRATKAKFLLTSRRDEHGWLRDLPRRVSLPPMPMTERVQLARAIADKYGRRLTDVDDWRPLLRYTQGNPLTITVVVGTAFRQGLRTREDVERFVARLQAGEAELLDDESLGRTSSLAASLGYGFDATFSDAERSQLALLYLFQGFVDVDVLSEICRRLQTVLPATLKGLAREAAGMLLGRAAEIGLLTALGGPYYEVHPALPWYFQRLFRSVYGEAEAPEAVHAVRAFVEVFDEMGGTLQEQYNLHGRRDVLNMLMADEPNLLGAQRMARERAWWDLVIGTMQGLMTLYTETGRGVEWARLVEELLPDFVDPETDGPLPGREEPWLFITDYRVKIARNRLSVPEAERLQEARLAFDRRRAAAALSVPPDALTEGQRYDIKELAVSLETMGHIVREQGRAACRGYYEEEIRLFQRIGIRMGEALGTYNLAKSYLELEDDRDLDQAETWYERSLGLHNERDNVGRARCLGSLGQVQMERLKQAVRSSAPQEELNRLFQAGISSFRAGIDLLPESAVGDLSAMHGSLGNLYSQGGAMEPATFHLQQALRYSEAAGDRLGAASDRFNLALALTDAGQPENALLYARAALADLDTFGPGAQALADRARNLIAELEQLRSGSPGAR